MLYCDLPREHSLSTLRPRADRVTHDQRLTDLTRLSIGARARFRGAGLERSDLELLEALGLTEDSRFRVCQTGDPWIVQVRSTRIGIAEAVARQIRVLPEEPS